MNEMSKPEEATAAPEVDELAALVVAARAALTDQMVERLATTGGTALALVDRLNDEDTNAALHQLLNRLTEMQKVGALDTAIDMIMLMHAARSALTDSMVERLVMFGEHAITNVANEEVFGLVGDACEALTETSVEMADKPQSGGLMQAIKLLSKPETMRALNFMIHFADKLQARAGTCK